jgi:hypothetical protein
LIESAAGGVSLDRSAGPKRDDFGIVWRAWAERAVGVVVLDVVVEELFELSAVPDDGAVTEFAAYGADPTFRVRVHDRRVGRVRMIVVRSLRKTSSGTVALAPRRAGRRGWRDEISPLSSATHALEFGICRVPVPA